MLTFKTYISESKKADQYEIAVANYLKDMGLNATRPAVNATYSDILIKDFNGQDIWIEVKMNHTDQLGNTRAFFNGKNWDASKDKAGPSKGKLGPLKKYIVKKLDIEAKPFLDDLRKFVGRDDIIVPTTIGLLRNPKSVTQDEMKAFLKKRPAQYIINLPKQNLGKLVTDHYNNGKSEPTNYMQAGDDFYRIGKKDPLKLGNKIPLFSGEGPFKMRIGMRTKYYEVQPEVKITGGMPNSPYSIKPGTKKLNPFKSIK